MQILIVWSFCKTSDDGLLWGCVKRTCFHSEEHSVGIWSDLPITVKCQLKALATTQNQALLADLIGAMLNVVLLNVKLKPSDD